MKKMVALTLTLFMFCMIFAGCSGITSSAPTSKAVVEGGDLTDKDFVGYPNEQSVFDNNDGFIALHNGEYLTRGVSWGDSMEKAKTAYSDVALKLVKDDADKTHTYEDLDGNQIIFKAAKDSDKINTIYFISTQRALNSGFEGAFWKAILDNYLNKNIADANPWITTALSDDERNDFIDYVKKLTKITMDSNILFDVFHPERTKVELDEQTLELAADIRARLEEIKPKYGIYRQEMRNGGSIDY